MLASVSRTHGVMPDKYEVTKGKDGGDRVMVPQVEGADMEVGDDVEVTRDQQGNYEAEAGHDYGR